MAMVSVVDSQPPVVRVRIDSDGRVTTHSIDLSARGKYVGDAVEDEQLALESMQFLLEREPASSIMQSFTLDDIVRYFAEYPVEIRRRTGS